MPQPLVFAGGAFAPLHRQLVGDEPPSAALDPVQFPPNLVQRARITWLERVHTEYRSAQLLSQMLCETLAAGDPFDIHAAIVDAVRDELRHVALCAGLAGALGATPMLPEPTPLTQSPQFLAMPAAKRALSIGITMLLVNETLSVGYIRDLHARCKQPAVSAVLTATLADEAAHDGLGLAYVRRALDGISPSERAAWRQVAEEAVRPQRDMALAVLRDVPRDRQALEAFPDEPEVALGLFSPARQALVCLHTYETELAPRLRELDLWTERMAPER